MTRLRRAGSPWRLLAHSKARSFHVTNWRLFGRATTGNEPDSDLSATHELQGTEFDELVVGRWIHIEQMDTGFWWMNIGGVTVHVKADRDGRPTMVRVAGPGDYDLPVEGCQYGLTWSAGTPDFEAGEGTAPIPDLAARDARKAVQEPCGGTNRPALVSGELHAEDSSAQSAPPTCTQTPGGNP